ncbi:Putative cardiolipin synthase YbhO [Lacunisphaera limnophila]|uniref:Cardiolipin synthase YbhO n=1 Tax=Lacunisphaera limnophila TaxID=1838286 RepID=A0A1D8B004_9BACT|nr:phospholipase D family protein [Lacunisphaera limnophila]AOS46470.1 Putative cardiolipin synthase YbhO [Lacunisphaera limnophila]
MRLAIVLLLMSSVLALRAAPLGDSPLGLIATEVLAAADKGDRTRGNHVTLLEGGYDALLLRVHLIRHAQTSIAVQTFIWSDDECGRLLMYELIEAAKRGVQVRIIADHLFSDQDPDTVAFLATVHPNFAIKHYRPAFARIKPSRLQLMLAGLKSFHAVNQRMHNKIMLFDDAVLVTGGRNIENSYFNHATGLNYRDRDVLVVGPAARAAAESFQEFWDYRHAVPSAELTDVAAVMARGNFRRYPRREDWDFGGLFGALEREAGDAGLIRARFGTALKPVARAKFIADEPGKGQGFFSTTARITRELRGTLEQARTRVTIQTPYLVLSGPAQRLIAGMQTRNPGLVIRVSTNSFASTDNLPAYSANYRLRGDYIEKLGLQVHEFMPQPAARSRLFPQYERMAARATQLNAADGDRPFLSLHAKSLVVDDRFAFVGSYNLDPRSENLNCEAGLLVEDEALARALRDEIDRDLQPENSWVIARRRLPLRLDAVNGLIDGVMSLSPVDLWPVQNTSSFELKRGAPEVAPGHPDFYEHHRDVGSFPGAEGALSTKEILTRLYKAVGTPLTPVL